jgi:acyl carrier protein
VTTDLSELREVLGEALGDDRLARVAPDAPLLQGGVVSSLELIVLLAALEERYALQLPPGRAAQSLSSLAAIQALVEGRAVASPRVVRPGYASWRRYTRRPLWAALAVLLALAAIDSCWRLAVETVLWEDYLAFREHGQRLYPLVGDLAQDDFGVAAAAHEIHTQSDPAEGWVVVLGDSGTIGSYLTAAEAIPAQAQARLREQGLQARVTNLAFYGRVLAKDLMLLELIRDEPLRAVVFTVGDDHLSRELNGVWLRNYPHVSLNSPLLERYVERLPAAEQAPFGPTLAALRDADARHWGPLRRLGYARTGLSRYRHYMRGLLLDRALPAATGTRLKLAQLVRDQRLSRGGPTAIRQGVPSDDLDPLQEQILRGAISRLRARGVEVVLLVEPAGPREWRPPPQPGFVATTPRYQRLAAETGAHLLDLRWALTAEQFTDTLAHYTADGSRLLGRELGDALAEALR